MGSSTYDLVGVKGEELEVLFSRDHQIVPGSFSPDGQALAFYEVHPTTRRDLHVLDLGDDGASNPFLVTPANEREPVFSADGRFIAYVSDESGRDEIYVRPYPGPGGMWTVSTDGGDRPRWSSETGELFYWEGNQIMAVPVETEPEFKVGRPSALFGGVRSAINLYDVAPDGQSFFVLQRDSAPKELRVIFNWFEELKRLAPADD